MTTSKVTTYAILAGIALALSLAVVASSLFTPALARITPETTDTSCTNPGGNQYHGR
jgi:hypothetical protein